MYISSSVLLLLLFPADATMRDLVLAVRADEACHSHVNHTFAGLSQDQENPFAGKDSTVLP